MEQLTSTAFTTGSFNISTTSGPSSPSSITTAIWVLLSLFFLVGVPGNTAVIILRPNREHLCSVSQLLMMNLAVSDLLCLLTIPMWIYKLLNKWIIGLVVCKMLIYVVYCSILCSLLTVTALSIQRYLLVVRQQRWLDGAVQKTVLLVLLWLVALAVNIPTVMAAQLKNKSSCELIFSDKTQHVALLLRESILGFIVPFSVVTFAYSRIHRTVNRTPFFNHPQTTWVVTSVIIMFFVLWAPYHVINVVTVASILLKNAKMEELCMNMRIVAVPVAFLSSSLNPLLYAFSSQKICIMCKNIFKHKCCHVEPQTSETS